MNHQRLLVFAILIVVMADVATPGLPGALVFDADGCVEGLQGNGVRRPGSDLVLAVPSNRLLVQSRIDDDDRGSLVRVVLPATHAPVNWTPRVRLDPAPSSEDPL